VLLEPLARLPLHVAYFVFLTVTGLLGALSAFLFGRQLGWKHPELLAVGSFLSWFGFSSLLQGQVDALLLAALLGSLLLMAVTPIAWLWIPFGLVWIAVAALLIAAIPALRQEMVLADGEMGQGNRRSSSTLSLTLVQPRPGPSGSQIP
jgi:hypothetical protein